jgi:hypothetical protein
MHGRGINVSFQQSTLKRYIPIWRMSNSSAGGFQNVADQGSSDQFGQDLAQSPRIPA